MLDDSMRVAGVRIPDRRASERRTPVSRRASALVGICAGAGIAGYTTSYNAKYSLLASLALCVCLTGVLMRPTAVATIALLATFVTSVRFHVGPMNLFPEQLMLIPLGISLVCHSKIDRLWSALTEPAVAILGVFIAYSAVNSILTAPDPSASLRVVGWMALSWVLLLFVLATFERGIELETRMVAIMSLVAAASIGIYLGDQVTGGTFLTHVEPLSGGAALSGFSSEQNVFGGVLALWVFIAVTSDEFRAKWYYSAGSILGAIAVILALTRSAVLALVLGLFVWAVIQGGQSGRTALRWLTAAAVIAVLALVLLPSASGPVAEKLAPDQLINVSSGTGAARSESVGGALNELTRGGWLAGKGTNSYGQRHFYLYASNKEAYLPSLPVQIWYDTGLVGLCALVVAYIYLSPWNRPGRARAIGCTVVFMVGSIATSTFWFGSTWVVIALALLSTRRVALSESRDTPATTGPLDMAC